MRTKLKHRILPQILIATLLLLVFPSCKCGRQAGPMDPLLGATTMDQRTFQPMPGHFLIVNFWATWCGPCIQETPSLLKLAAAHPDKIQLLSISVDASVNDVKKFLALYPASQAANIFIVHDSLKKYSQAYQVSRFPESYIFSSDGKPLKKIPGAVNWNDPEVLSLFSLKPTAN